MSLQHLPEEVLLKILQYLDYKDLISCGVTCQRIQDITTADPLWKHLCRKHWLVTKCPKGKNWFQHFRGWYRDFGRYISVYRVVKTAWNKIEAFTRQFIPAVYQDLNAGISDGELDVLQRRHRVTYPLDLRCSYRLHNGQKADDGSYTPGLLGSLVMHQLFVNETICPVAVNYMYLDNPEEFSDLHMLSYCYRSKVGAVMALSELGGHALGQVFYQVPDCNVLNSPGGGVFMEDKFILANSYSEWLTSHADNLEKNSYPVIQDYIFRFFREPSCIETSNHISVTVASAFLPRLSSVHPPYFVYAYRITLSMSPEAPQSAACQLRTRHWIITEDDGTEQRVDGPGVVGEFPVLAPGSTHSWVSSTSFHTTHGYMKGHFMMRKLDTGVSLRVECPVFHMKCLPYQGWEERKEIVLQRKKQQKEQGLPPTADVLELEMDERGQNWGYTSDEAHELLCYGIKPWEDDADGFLEQLHEQWQTE